MDIAIGTTVRLKAGGPLMSVHDIDDRGQLGCVWFDKDNKVAYGYFRPEIILKFSEIQKNVGAVWSHRFMQETRQILAGVAQW